MKNGTTLLGNPYANAPYEALPPTKIPLNFSTPSSPAYQQFAYSNVGSGGTDVFAARLTEKDFLTGKMYLTDDRTITGNDVRLAMPWAAIGGASTTGTLNVEPEESVTLPFGGFPGSRRFQ